MFVDKNKAVISGVFWLLKVKPGSDLAANAFLVSLEPMERLVAAMSLLPCGQLIEPPNTSAGFEGPLRDGEKRGERNEGKGRRRKNTPQNIISGYGLEQELR